MEFYKQFNQKIDIMVTHGPPLGILDLVSPIYPFDENGKYIINHEDIITHSDKIVGCEGLREFVFKIKPTTHIFGHIHESAGRTKINGIDFINASCLNGQYKMTNKNGIIGIV